MNLSGIRKSVYDAVMRKLCTPPVLCRIAACKSEISVVTGFSGAIEVFSNVIGRHKRRILKIFYHQKKKQKQKKKKFFIKDATILFHLQC